MSITQTVQPAPIGQDRLKGAADGFGQRQRDGRVSLGELFEYVREQVKESTGGSQHPVIGAAPFDRNLTVAITGQVNSADHIEIGRGLFEVARMLDEPLRYLAAAAHFDEAASLAGMAGGSTIDAELSSARCLVAGHCTGEALRALDRLVARGPATGIAEAYFWLGIARADQRDYPGAVAAFAAFLEQAPNHRDAPWVRGYVDWLSDLPRSVRRHALLIGIDQYKDARLNYFGKLFVNSTRMLFDTLVKSFGFANADVVLLHDTAATRAGVLEAWSELAQRLGSGDQVWVYYGGRAVSQAAAPDELYLLFHDTEFHDTELHRGRFTAGMTAQELHSAMSVLPAEQIVLVLDTDASEHFNRLAEDAATYTALLATAPAHKAYSIKLIDGLAGLFTAALHGKLASEKVGDLTFGRLMNDTISYVSERQHDQTPLLIGDPDRPVFAREDYFLSAFRFAERRSNDPLPLRVLQKRYQRLRDRKATPFPSLHLAYGRAFLAKKDPNAALLALETALEQRDGDWAEPWRALAAAHLVCRQDDAALRACQPVGPDLAEAALMIGRLCTARRHALIVGIRRYLDPELPEADGAVNDALLMRHAIVEHCGFRAEDVTLLMDREASRERLLSEFDALVKRGCDEHALFFFAGHGSTGAAGAPVLLPADGRAGGAADVPLAELAHRAAGASELVSIIDAEWVWVESGRSGTRSVPAIGALIQASGGLGGVRVNLDHLDRALWQVGSLTVIQQEAIDVVLNISEDNGIEIEVGRRSERPSLLGETVTVHGRLTYRLVCGLLRLPDLPTTYGSWLAATEAGTPAIELVVLGERDEDFLFDCTVLRRKAMAQLRDWEDEPIRAAQTVLRRLIHECGSRHDPYPAGRLSAGMASVIQADFDAGIPLLERAASLYEDSEVLASERTRDSFADAWRVETHYQLGRALRDSKRNFTRAVGQLNLANELDPENPRVLYHLGLAIRAMVDHETLAKAEAVLTRYLALGAPLGNQDEIRRFLGSRRHSESALG
jgi:tetratricopeptide (TPR) repeat protein